MEVPGSAEGTGKNSPACQEVRTLSSLEKLSRGVLFLWTLGIVWLIGGRSDTDGENRRNKWESTAAGGLQSFLLLLLRGKVTSHKAPLERLCASALMSHHCPEGRLWFSGFQGCWLSGDESGHWGESLLPLCATFNLPDEDFVFDTLNDTFQVLHFIVLRFLNREWAYKKIVHKKSIEFKHKLNSSIIFLNYQSPIRLEFKIQFLDLQ